MRWGVTDAYSSPDVRLSSWCAGPPMHPCDGCHKPLHTSADALIPILMSLRVALATSPTRSGAASVGVKGERRPRCLMARAGALTLGVPSLIKCPY